MGEETGVVDAGGSAAGVAGITSVAIIIISLIAMFGGAEAQRFLLTFSIGAILYATLVYSPTIGVPMTMVYLSGFAMAKRYLIPVLGYTSYDPLLLVQPVVIGVFFMNLILRRHIPFNTILSKVIGVLLLIMLAEMANPAQGGITVSLSGGLFYIVPLLWFYAGRTLGTRRVAYRLLITIIVVAVFGVIYGLWQQFVGFSEVEKQWLELTKNDEGQYLNNSVMRVFSFFSSFAEYVEIAAIACVICWVLFLKRNRLAIIPWIFLMVGVLLSSSRGSFLASIFGATIVWAVQSRTQRTWIPRLVVAAIIGVAVVYTGLNQVKQDEAPTDTADTLLQWQAKGILKVTDAQQSTGVIHTNMVLDGFVRGFTNPLGTGLGSTTLAAVKFGDGRTYATETDFGDMFVACGLIGGLLYFGIIGYVLWLAATQWHRERSIVSLAIFGLLASTIASWLIGARYAECMFTWFFIGFLDKKQYEYQLKMKLSRIDDSPIVPQFSTPATNLANTSLTAPKAVEG
jgi:hypothetical protein